MKVTPGGAERKPVRETIERLGRSAPDQSAGSEEELIRTHLPLVNHAIQSVLRRVPRHVSSDELASSALLGLVQAIRSFDPDRGVPFERYASTRIQGALLDELRSRDWASRSVRARSHEIRAATEELTARLGHAPSVAELAKEVRLHTDEVQQLLDDLHRSVILNFEAIAPGGEAAVPNDHRSPEVMLIEREQRGYLYDAVAALPDRLRTVVVGYFFEERPMQEIAEELGVTESRVSQMRAEALVLLRDGINSQLDPDRLPAEERPDGRVAKRKAAYYAALAANSDFRARLSVPDPGATAMPVLGTGVVG
ncbi:MAG TPA: sigma-70 family RNA polymerase sigma factor [Acidimicrobiia bacterium]|nr:sigma-70 family RNA polymerase sigma factor [Acidimicrobiia bacterium]